MIFANLDAYQFYAYLIEISVVLAGIPICYFFIPESDPGEKQTQHETRNFRSSLKTLLNWNLFVLTMIAILQNIAHTIVQTYYQYYIADIVHLPIDLLGIYQIDTTEAALSLFTIARLVGSILSSVPSG